MKKLIIDIVCRATERSECLKLRSKLFEKVYPFIKAADVSVEFLTTFLPYLPNEEPIDIPSVRVLGLEEAEKEGVVGLRSLGSGYEEALEAISL